MRFRYQGYPVRGIEGGLTQVYRPSIPLRIIGPARDSIAFGLLDTGADDTLLPDRFIAMLGVTIRPGMRAPLRGIGGGADADFGVVDLQLRAHRWSSLVGFYAGDRVLLGHSGFLEHFAASPGRPRSGGSAPSRPRIGPSREPGVAGPPPRG